MTTVLAHLSETTDARDGASKWLNRAAGTLGGGSEMTLGRLAAWPGLTVDCVPTPVNESGPRQSLTRDRSDRQGRNRSIRGSLSVLANHQAVFRWSVTAVREAQRDLPQFVGMSPPRAMARAVDHHQLTARNEHRHLLDRPPRPHLL